MIDPLNRLKELVEPCPTCSEVLPFLDLLKMALEKHGRHIWLKGQSCRLDDAVILKTDTITVHCGLCYGRHEVLTEVGKRLADLLPNEMRPERAPADEGEPY